MSRDIFGGRTGGGGFRTAGPSRGRDIQHDMTIDLLSALRGFDTELSMQKPATCQRCQGTGNEPGATMRTCPYCGGSGRQDVASGPMHFTKTCPQCHGHGKIGTPCTQCGGSGQAVGTEKIRVVIPSGVKEGSKVRVAGKGEPGAAGGASGDLYLIIHVKDHPFLKREGDNLLMDVPVTLSEAMAGGTINIPTLEGSVKLKIPAGSQNGQTLRLKGKGALNLKTRERGNMMIKLFVTLPKTEDSELLEAIKKMDQLYGGDVRAAIKL